jgi:hypothetical protein
LEQALQQHLDVLEGIDDRPLAISGNYVAFRYRGASAHSTATGGADDVIEDIVTLPTRGLFAEAQIGSCNSCEKRDITRMWNWSEMPAETLPEMTGISPGPKGTAPAIAQGQLPSNVIQITQPQTAPDPTGLANVLGVLKTPDIFRDMAGLEHVSKLLGDMAKLATDANTQAMALQAKAKVDEMKTEKAATDGGGAGDGAAPSSGISAADSADRFSLVPEIKSFAKGFGLTADETKQFALDQMYGTKPTTKPAQATPKVPQAKSDEVVMSIHMYDYQANPTDALTIDCRIIDDLAGEITPQSTGYKVHPSAASIPSERGWLEPIKGLTKGSLQVHVEMQSVVGNMSSIVGLDGVYNYDIAKGVRYPTFYATQDSELVKYTVHSGDTLEKRLAQDVSVGAKGELPIKIIQAAFEAKYAVNWGEVKTRSDQQDQEFSVRVPVPHMTITATPPRVSP